MIVVDSSVWIGNLRSSGTPAVRRLQSLVQDRPDEIVVGDLILLEVLQGARDEAHAARLETELSKFDVVSLSSRRLAVQAARNHRHLRALGVTVRRTIDLVIGTFCIDGGHALLHDDRDFMPMAAHLGLRLE